MDKTRRTVSTLILASPALLSSGPAAAFFHKGKPLDFGARLQAELQDQLAPNCGGTFTVTKFEMKKGQRVVMASVVRLDWEPGFRTRLIRATGDEAEATYNALFNKASFQFAKAWPGCVV